MDIKPSEIAIAIKPVVEALEELGVTYYLGGSVASSTYGVARSTLDVDMVSNLKSEHVKKLIAQLKDSYYISEPAILEALKLSSSFNLIHLGSGIKIDVFISKARPYDEVAAARIRQDSLTDDESAPRFYLAAPEDVILAKLDWFRKGGEISTRQWADILGVIKVQRKNLDVEYLRIWAQRIGVQDLFEKAAQEAAC